MFLSYLIDFLNYKFTSTLFDIYFRTEWIFFKGFILLKGLSMGIEY